MKQFPEQLIDKTKWADIMYRFVDVLRINMFLVDHDGHILIAPVKGQGNKLSYGCELLTNSPFGMGATIKPEEFIQRFERIGSYYELKDPFDLHTFAIPVSVIKEGGKTIAYVILGPIILNKRLEHTEYQEIAKRLNFSCDDLMGAINEIRVVSFLTIQSILDLLAALIRDVIEHKLEQYNLDSINLAQDGLSKKFRKAAEEIYASIHMDELLVTLLDAALNITKTECGSIMILDEKKGELIIKVSRGLDETRVQNTRLKLGEGIAGLAAKDNSPFLIKGTQGENRIKHLLKRPEIKQAIVMPLSSKNKVYGVLNLHTKKEESKIEDGLENLQHLSKLISATFTAVNI